VLALQDVKSEGTRISFTLVQRQEGAAFPLSFFADIETQAGDQRVRLDMEKKSQRYSVTTKAGALALHVDPNFDVFRRLSLRETPPIFRDVTLNADTHLVAPGNHPGARPLAERLMQGPVPETQANPVLPFKGTLIVAGLKADVMPFLQQSGLPRPPRNVDASAPAIAYVLRENSGRTTLVAMADDDASLTQLARVLPHYKRRSFAVMQGGRVTDKGTWPAPTRPLSVRLD